MIRKAIITLAEKMDKWVVKNHKCKDYMEPKREWNATIWTCKICGKKIFEYEKPERR